MNDQAQDLKNLRERRPSIDQILQCSPFDNVRNLGGDLSADLFFSNLFVGGTRFLKMSRTLSDALFGKLMNLRLIFLEGYSGTGKTTFINHFLRETPGLYAEYIDFQPLAGGIDSLSDDRDGAEQIRKVQKDLQALLKSGTSGAGETLLKTAIAMLEASIQSSVELDTIKEKNHPIARALQRFLCGEKDQFANFVYFLESSRSDLVEFFEQDLAAVIRTQSAKMACEDPSTMWSACTLQDTLIIFLLYYSLLAKERSEKKLNVFVFDNLDTIELAYLTPFFKQKFAAALTSFSDLLQKKKIFHKNGVSLIDFERDFKFIFCLRDANSSYLNSHLTSIYDPVTMMIHIRAGLEGDAYGQILEKRLELITAIGAEPQDSTEGAHARQAVRILKALTNDDYFKRVFLPLFNFDFRRAIIALYVVIIDILQSHTTLGLLTVETAGDEFVEKNKYQFGMRGALFHGIIKQLHENDFLGDYGAPKPGQSKSDEGYCLPLRMILTFLLNKSNLRRGEDVFSQSSPLQPVELAAIIGEAGGLYSYNQIVEHLVDAFQYHQKSWVHLVTFRGRRVADIRSLNGEVAVLEQNEPMPKNLDGVLVTLNPSGFVFLKNLIVHFEFYSVLAGNERSLFSVGLTRAPVGASDDKFLFETHIRKVLEVVRRHVSDMRRFYQGQVRAGRWRSETDYLTSQFVFKHFKYSGPASVGLFHSSRIISDHLRYLDYFRLELLRRSPHVDPIDRIEINKRIIPLIREYLAIWEQDNKDLGETKKTIASKSLIVQRLGWADTSTQICPSKPILYDTF